MIDLIGKIIKHKAFGRGTVIEQAPGYLVIEFPAKTTKFQYPTAFEKFLVPEEETVLAAIKAEMTAEKEVAETAQKAEEERKALLEQARLEELRNSTKGGKYTVTKEYKKI